jgi:hypothetical protein
MARRPPPSATVMKVKKVERPMGAKRSWSIATRWRAGTRLEEVVVEEETGLRVMGNAWERKPNHLNWMGAMRKPKAMKRVKRSKSKGGGALLVVGIRVEELWVAGFSLRSVSSMEIRGPSFWMDCEWGFVVGRVFRRVLMAVRDWATVSAMPPRIWKRGCQSAL